MFFLLFLLCIPFLLASMMRKAAKEDIARERERAAMQLRGEMVALSMQAAGKIIAANMDNKTNEKLVSDFIDQLDKDKMGGLPC